MNLTIREATINDYIGISKLVAEVHSLHVKNRPDVYIDIDTPLQSEQFEEVLNKENMKVFVVENTDNKELAAYSIMKIMQTQSISIIIQMRVAFIDDFCVKTDYKKKGIGRLLFRHVVDYAKSEGASSLQLIVWEFNKDAIKFYEAMGMGIRNRRMELTL